MASDIVITPSRGSTSVNAKIDFTGASTASSQIRLEVLPDNSLAFVGTTGSLFSIADSVTGSLMSVNDASGLPILEVFDTDKVVMGQYNQNTLVVNGTNVGIGTASPNSKLEIRGGTNNQTYDATVYITADNNNDWGLRVDKYRSAATNYGIRVDVVSGDNNAITVYGSSSEKARISGDGQIITSGNITGPGYYNSADTATRFINGSLVLRSSAPTIYFRDTDHNSAMIHVNSNIFYILRGNGVDSESWSQVNGRWPMEIDLTNNNMAIGGNLNVAAGTGTVTAATFSGALSGNATTATTATNWGTYGAVPAAGTSFGGANTIGRSDANGYTYFYYINSNTSNNENGTVSQFVVTNGTDNFYRKASLSHVKSQMSLNNVENTAISTWAGSSNITTLGTISTGTWNGTTIALTKGGTGATDAATARTNLGLANSATITAYSSNGYNSLVLRDASGNFQAGTITADLNGTASYLSGLTLSSSASPVNPDNVTKNQLGYDTSVALFGQGDGGLYSSAYDSSWIHQIHGDFRTGQIAIRGKNSGTWQAWRTVLDSSNYTSYTSHIGNGTLTLNTNSGSGLSGSASFTANQSGNVTFTVTSNATASNVANTLVLRDGSGNIFGQEIYASGWFRNYGYQGIYNQDYATHFYAGGTGYYNLAGNGSATDGGLTFRSGHQSTIKGRVYWDSAGFGLLNDSGNWAVRSNYGSQWSGGSIYGAWLKTSANNTGGITVPGVFIQSGVTSGTPTAIQSGDLWWNTDTGKLKIYWSSASAWVDATPVPDMAGYYTTGGGNINGNVNVNGLLESTGNITARIGQTYPVSIGSHPSYSGANYGALWRPGSNPVLLFDASNTYVNAPSLGAAVSFQVGNTTHAYVNSNGVTTNGSFIMSGGFTLSQNGAYGQTNNWIHLNGYHGLYSGNNSAHIYPNSNSSYGAWAINGSRNSWGGIYDNYSGIAWMGDAGGNGGLYRESNGRWYIYHNTAHNCTAIGSSNTTSGYAMQVTGSAYVTGSVNIAGNTAIHAGNYNSYAPTLTGGGASGSWGISVTGTSRYLAHIDGPRNLSDRNPNWSARTATFDFIGAGTAGTSGNYAGVLTFVPWDGTTGSTGDASYQLAFGSTATNGGGIPHLRIRKGIDTTWNSWYTIPIVGVNTGYQSSIYVDTFYDQGDTNYYLDPSGTSRVNTISFVSGATFGPYFQYGNVAQNLRLQGGSGSEIGISGYDFNGNWRFQLYGQSGAYGFLNGNWAGWDLQKNTSGNLYLNNQTTYYIGTNEIYYNRVYGVTDIRSPIFYDNNDTAYYIDPTSGQANSEGGKIKWNFTVNGEGATSGRGLALYPSYTSSVPTYGITFAQTASLGTHGNVTADWATYFTMNNTANRGWIFRDGNTPANVASINNAGRMRIASLGVNTDASATNGEIRATDNITAYYSDERLKTKLGAIENPIEKVKALSGFYFEANETAVALGYQKKREVGVSAQEVQAILPEIIAPAPIDDKYMTVRYEKLIPLLIEAIKAQQAQIEELQKLIKEKV